MSRLNVQTALNTIARVKVNLELEEWALTQCPQQMFIVHVCRMCCVLFDMRGAPAHNQYLNMWCLINDCEINSNQLICFIRFNFFIFFFSSPTSFVSIPIVSCHFNWNCVRRTVAWKESICFWNCLPFSLHCHRLSKNYYKWFCFSGFCNCQ